MASLANDNGLFRVVVNSPTRRGYPIRLGRVQKRFAERFRGRCDDLEDAVRLAEQPDAAVREWLDALDAQLHAKLVTAGLALPRVATQLKPWLEKDLASRVRLKDRSKKKLLRTHAFLLEFFGSGHDVRKISVDNAWDFHTWLHAKEHLADASIRTHCGNVKTIFRAAVKRGLIRVNPFADLPSGSTASAEPVFVSGDEIDQVIEKLPNATFKLLLGLSRRAGLRTPSETLSIRRRDVLEDVSMLYVRCTKTEAHEDKQERFVPICEKLRPLLIARMAECSNDDDLLCPIGSEKGIGGYAREVVEDAIEAAGLKVWPDRFQTLRSSLAKDWKARGIPEFAVDAWLGHNNVTSRKHYTSNVPPQMFELISGVKQAARNPAQNASELGGSKGKRPEDPKTEPAEIPGNSETFQRVPLPSETANMEAEGLEPSSRSNADSGLYMLISRFDLDPDAEHEHPAPGSSRLYLAL